MFTDSKPIIDQGSSPAGETDRPTAADVLRTALELIPSESRWLQGAYGEEADGWLVVGEIELYAAYDAGSLIRCCAEAALLLAHRRLHAPADYLFLEPKDSPYRLLCEQIGAAIDLAGFNDSAHTTYAAIANAFRRAIAVAEGREP